jgi:hypothetical protein
VTGKLRTRREQEKGLMASHKRKGGKNKKKKKKPPEMYAKPDIRAISDLFKRGNVGLARLLLAVNKAGPEGIATYRLLHKLGSTHHAKAFITRAEKAGYIKRVMGESEYGHFPLVYNILTKKGKQLLAQL